MIDLKVAAQMSRMLVPTGGVDQIAHFVLEDHDGAPIECPLCRQVDRWLPECEPTRTTPQAFVCRHMVETDDGFRRRRTARVGIEHVGGFLNLSSLLTSAA